MGVDGGFPETLEINLLYDPLSTYDGDVMSNHQARPVRDRQRPFDMTQQAPRVGLDRTMLADALQLRYGPSPDATVSSVRLATKDARGTIVNNMTPVTFNGCFGWLHAPQRSARSDVAILVCSGLMRDALLAYSSLRILADDLAAAGYVALRFDYPGTGNSCDDATERDGHWSAWQASVDHAADWLLAKSGAKRLVIVGLRLGTTLATLAASRRDDVAGLLLFEPVTSGRNYVRQLLLEAEMLSGARPIKGEDLYLREFCFKPSTLDQIDEVDLRKVRMKPDTRVAICTQAESKATECASATWRAAGVNVVALGWAGLDPLVRHRVIDEDVLADFSSVTAWLCRAVPAHAQEGAILLDDPMLRTDIWLDTPLRFGVDNRLFGMLCRPAQGTPHTAIIIGNAGHDPHYATARHAVTLARKLAAKGVASLRLDYSGLGDSIGHAGKERMLSHVFLVDRGPDVRAAIDALQELGFHRFGIAGLCSGAYHAFRNAVAEPRISAVAAVNLPFFTLPGGDVLRYLEEKKRSPVRYFAKLFSRQSWATLTSVKIDYRGVLAGQLSLLRARVKAEISEAARRLGIIAKPSFAKQGMADLEKRGAITLFIFSPGEEAQGAFPLEFGAAGNGLSAYRGATMTVVPGMDHDLTAAKGRGAAVALMVDFFARI
jgi:dienelactone hydrolase